MKCIHFAFCFYFFPSDYNTSEQKQACKKHELYVSFRDLGWQVRQKAQFRLLTSNKQLKTKYKKLVFFPGLGLDHRAWRLCCVLLWWRMCFSTQRPHERHKSRHRANPGTYFPPKPELTADISLLNWLCFTLLGPFNVSWQRAKAVLRSHQAQCHISALLRRQLQCDPQEIQKYGR